MGLTQEHDAAKVRAATSRHLEALREKDEKASTSKGKRPGKEDVRPPKRSKPSSASQKDPSEASLREQTEPESFSLAKVSTHVFLGVLEDAYINDILSAAFAIARGTALPTDATLIDDLPLERAFITWLSVGV
ncbi:hypothetical protein O6P43_017043 [Quillaja saponaria]|uniref:Uncharacterized protein n=1 Tax=Quillaja saponaria TaxID=32244 RepID=A0AAD7LP34_QUISA|nr:hypothetical protein O6P43_017043 [Quillaja saponaria]